MKAYDFPIRSIKCFWQGEKWKKSIREGIIKKGLLWRSYLQVSTGFTPWHMSVTTLYVTFHLDYQNLKGVLSQ